jgi:rhamnosyltransferase
MGLPTLQNTAAVVVTYRPIPEYAANVRRYQANVRTLYVVDNSETMPDESRKAFLAIPNVRLIEHGENLGIAAALNSGARHALADGHEWLLTMDQDSIVPDGMIERLEHIAMEEPDASIVSPYQQFNSFQKPPSYPEVQDMPFVITSGNLLNLKIFQSVGPFDENMFIDYVDFEYCLRIRKSGYRILQVNDVILKHRLGSPVTLHLGRKSISLWTHHPLRYYYRARNRRYLCCKYLKIFPSILALAARDTILDIVLILISRQEIKTKFHMVMQGRADHKAGRMGRYNHNTTP